MESVGGTPGLPEILIIAVIFLVAAVIYGVKGLLFYKLLAGCPEEHRTMKPGMAWLVCIPCFEVVWNFVLVLALADSYKAYFDAQGDTEVGSCGRGLGIGYAIAAIMTAIPYANLCAGPVTLVLFILYLVKMFELRGRALRAPSA